MRSAIATVAAALCACMCAAPGSAADAPRPLLRPVSTAPADAKPLSAKDAGARYGEAAGAVLVCYGLRITPQVADLRARYQGADLAEFDAQAGKILQAWRETLDCQHAEGPNDCKVSQQWSCRQALQEIGPSGSAVRGLVEPKN
jgi:hypothetical protein